MVFDLAILALGVPPDGLAAQWGMLLLAFLVMAVAMTGCVRALRSEGTNRVGVSAMILFLLGAGLYAAGRVASAHGLPDWPVASSLRLILLVIGVGAFLLGLVALILHNRRLHHRGRAHAALAMLAGVVLGSASARDLSNLIESASRPLPPIPLALASAPPQTPTADVPAKSAPDPIAPVTKAPETSPPAIAGNGAMPPATEKNQEASSTPARPPLVIEDNKNAFALELPHPWKEIPVLGSGEEARRQFARTWPGVHLLVLRESLPGITLDAYAEAVGRILAQGNEILDQSSSDVVIGENQFRVIASRVRLKNITSPFRYEHWLHIRGSDAWQMVFWSMNLAPTRLTKETRPIMESFRPLASGALVNQVRDFRRPDLGLAVEFPDEWVPIAKGSMGPLFQCGLQRRSEAMVLAGIPSPSADIPISHLAKAMFTALEFPADGDQTNQRTGWRPANGLEGGEWRFKRAVDGDLTFDYLLRLVRGEKTVWITAGWATEKNGDLDLVRRNLDAIRFGQPEGEPLKDSADTNSARALFWNQVGLQHFEQKEFLPASSVFRHAFALTGESDFVMLDNAANALESAEKIEEALELLKPHAGKEATRRDINLRLARLHVLAGDPPAGAKIFLSCDDGILDTENALLEWMKFLNNRDLPEVAIGCAEEWIKKRPDLNPRRWLAQTLLQADRTDEAVALFRKLCAEFPDNQSLRHDLAETLNEAGEHEQAAATAQAIIADGKASARTHIALAWSHYGRKWYKEAKSSFEEAARLSPEDQDIKDNIRDVSAKLGQGNNSSIKEPLAPVPLPDAIAKRLAKPKLPENFGEGFAAAWIYRATGWYFKPGEPLRRTVRMKVKVMDAEGADAFSTIEFPFDPLYEKVHLHKLEVLDAKGKPVGSAKTDDAYVRDDDDGMATHDQILSIQVPGVTPGCTVAWEITVQSLPPVKIFPYERVLMASYLPVGSFITHVSGDIAAIRSHLAQGESLETPGGKDWKAWISPPRIPEVSEPAAVWPEERQPFLTLSGDEGDWASVGKKYLTDIKDRLPVEPAVRDLALSLTKDCTDARSKVAVLARHAQKSIAYKAIEFGVRARRPNAASETLRLHYGDCKDTSLLLHQMLTAVGVKSHLALVDTGWKLLPAFPSLDQFDHMIVHVPELGPDHFIDPTDKTLDLGKYPADNLWHATVLSLDPDGPKLIAAPTTAAAGSSDANIRRTVSLDGGAWRVDESLTLTGYYASSMRDSFLGLSPEEQQRRAQRIISAQGNARLESFVFHGLDDPGAVTRLHMIYTVQAPMPIIGTARHAALPALWEKDYLSTTFVKDRRSDFRISYPFRLKSETTLLPPPGLLPESVAALAASGKSEWSEWKFEIPPVPEKPDGPVTIQFHFTSTAGRFPAKRYHEFHEAWEAARAAWDKTIAWSAQPETPVTPP